MKKQTIPPGTLDRLSTVEGLLRRAQGEIDSAIILDDDTTNAGDGQAAWVVVPLLQAVQLLADEVKELRAASKPRHE